MSATQDPRPHGRALRGQHLQRLLWIVLAAAASLSCAHIHARDSVKSRPAVGPDMTGVLRMTTRYGLAHGCPVSATLALTAGHVLDPRPFDPTVPMIGAQWTTPFGGKGLAHPLGVSTFRDLAKIAGEFTVWFPIAKTAPEPGLPVYALGYDYRDPKRAFASVTYKLEVARLVGGLVVMKDADPRPGSSGGCVVNAAGELVGIIDGGWSMDNLGRVITAVGVWGETFEDPTPAEPSEPPQ